MLPISRLTYTSTAMNPVTANRRHYEDLAIGEVIDLGTTSVSKEMIVSFAREFDPFPFHLDEEAAKASLLGGLASSGWQTAALTLRMLGDSFLTKIASMGGLGFSLPPSEPAGTMLCAPKRCTNDDDCAPSGSCASVGGALFCGP